MPSYDFECTECGHTFTHVSKIVDRDAPFDEECKECGSLTNKRVYSAALNIIDPGILLADKRMENSGVQGQLERIRDQCNPNMDWKG